MVFEIILVIVLVCLSATFSGLTLGLMGLDLNELQVVIGGGNAVDAANARKIAPIRANGNRLLCTLLLGNVAVNAALSIVMADLTSGLIGFLLSTVTITLFGEILPQAICSRHPLAVGARSVWLVRFFQLVLIWAVVPLAYALDKLLGQEVGTLYTKTELNKVLEMHKAAPGIQNTEVLIMTGALNFGQRQVRDIMTPIDRAFMLDVHRSLNFEVLTEIFKAGYSRVPVFDSSRAHNPVVGLLLVKDMILLDPMDATPVWTIVNFYGREVTKVFPDCTLQDLLETFKEGKSHLAIVHDVINDGPGDPYYTNVGLVTLEDIIEEILQSEIVDETDTHGNTRHQHKLLAPRRLMPDCITPQELSAIYFHLSGAVPLFHPDSRLLGEHSFRQFIANGSVIDLKIAKKIDDDDERYWLYRRGVKSDWFTLILDGKVDIFAGRAGFQSELGRWSILCADALEDVHSCLPSSIVAENKNTDVLPLPDFLPDFSCQVKENCRVLRLSRKTYFETIVARSPKPTINRQLSARLLNTPGRMDSILKSVPIPKNNDDGGDNIELLPPPSQQQQQQQPQVSSSSAIDTNTTTTTDPVVLMRNMRKHDENV